MSSVDNTTTLLFALSHDDIDFMSKLLNESGDVAHVKQSKTLLGTLLMCDNSARDVDCSDVLYGKLANDASSVDDIESLLDAGYNPLVEVPESERLHSCSNAFELALYQTRDDAMRAFARRGMYPYTSAYHSLVDALEATFNDMVYMHRRPFGTRSDMRRYMLEVSNRAQWCVQYSFDDDDTTNECDYEDSDDSLERRLVVSARSGVMYNRRSMTAQLGVADYISQGVYVNARMNGDTPILAAARTLTNADVIKALCEAGSNLELRDARNFAPVHVALSKLANMITDVAELYDGVPDDVPVNFDVAKAAWTTSVAEAVAGTRILIDETDAQKSRKRDISDVPMNKAKRARIQ